MKATLISILTFFSAIITAQVSEYLDTDYGENGIVTVESSGHPYFFYNFSIDSKGRAYLSTALLHQHPLDTFYSSYILKRIDETGQVEDWGIDNNLNNIPTTEDSLLILSWQANDHIYSYEYNEEDDLTTMVRYDLELNRLQEFEPVSFRNSIYNYAFSNGEFLEFDKNERLYLHHHGNISRHNNDGSLDKTFGDEGILKVYDLKNITDSLWHDYYADMKVVDDGLIYSSILSVDSMDVSYRSFLIKMDMEGNLVESFGNNGRFEADKNEIIFSIHESLDGNYKFVSGKNTEPCFLSHLNIGKITLDGDIDINYGTNGRLQNFEDCLGSDYNYNEGPEGYQLVNQIDSIIYNSDSTSFEYLYQFAMYTPEGQLDISFGNNGYLKLDSIPGDYFLHVTQDDENNVYISSVDTSSYSTIENDLYITKLRASKIWPSLEVEPENQSSISKLKLYPNPASNGLTLHYEGPELNDVSIEVINMLGQRVGILDMLTIMTGSQTHLDTYSYPSGQYFIRIIEKSNSLILLEEKLIIIEN